MKSKETSKKLKHMRSRGERKKWSLATIFISSAVLLFTVLCALIFPAIALEGRADPEIANNDAAVDVEDVIIDKFNISFVSGASRTKDADGNISYVWNPSESVSGHSFVYRADYSLSGVDMIPAGNYVLRLPLNILKDRDGNYADKFECAYPASSEVSKDDDVDFVYEIRDDYIYIYNYTALTTGTAGYIEFSYTTTKSTLSYRDMSVSDEVAGALTGKGSFEDPSDYKESTATAVTIDTHVTISSTSKQTPTYYTSWQSSWGDKPEDSNEYYYLVWPIYTTISKNTSPYDFTLLDTFINEEYKGELVSYRFSGSSVWVQPDPEKNNSATVTDQTSYGSRHDYVLTRYRKDTLSDLKEFEPYTLKNIVTATVTPVDGVDKPTSASGSKTWSYEAPKYVTPTGSFWAVKYGIFGSSSHVTSSNNISSYGLAEYLNGENSSGVALRYDAEVYGYPYPWTVKDGYTLKGTEEDTEHYGKKSVTYTLTDDTIYLKALTYNNDYAEEGYPVSGTEQKLDDGDYDITRLQWTASMYTATYNETTKKFVSSTIIDFSDSKYDYTPEEGFDKNTLYFYVRTAESKEWQLAATYDQATKTYNLECEGSSLVKTASGNILTFADDVKGYRIETSNPFYYTNVTAYPTVTLYRTAHVAQILIGRDNATADDLAKLEADDAGNGILSKIAVRNQAKGTVQQNGKNLFSHTVSAADYVSAVTRNSSIEKNAIATLNNKIKKQYRVTWQTTIKETYTDDSGVHNTKQESGTFYDLIPAGAVLDESSVAVKASGVTLSSVGYETTVEENYRNTGRQLLTVRVNKPTNTSYVLTYTTVTSWNDIVDYGTRLLNSVAYETGNEDIANGYPDNGGSIKEKELMADLTVDKSDNEAGTKKFLYSQASHTINALLAANTGLMKQVRSENDTDYSYSTTVTSNGTYAYRIRFANDAITASKDIMFFDSLEHFIQSTGGGIESDWYGSLVSIDTSQLTEQGVNVKVYVSSEDGMNINDLGIDSGYDFAENGWTQYKPGDDLSDVHAVAVDAREAVGGGAFTLAEKKSLTFTLHMQAPAEVTDEKDENGIEDPVTYNNIYMYRTAMMDGEYAGSSLYHQDYTQVHFRIAGDVLLKKVNAEDASEAVQGAEYLLRGTSDYGTAYSLTAVSDADGCITFTDVEKGTYELLETACTNDWLLNTEVYTVTIDETGTATLTGYGLNGEKDGDRYLVTDEPRVHGDLTFEKRDSITNHTIEGARFRLSGESEYGNDILLYATSTSEGCVSFEDVELGTYTLIEVSPADGYIISRTAWAVVVDDNGIITVYEKNDDGELTEVAKDSNGHYYQIQNEPYHSVQFVKTSTYGTNNYVSGAVFSLTGVSDYGTAVDMQATSGKVQSRLVVFDNLEPGIYALKEINTENATDTLGLSYKQDSKTYTVRLEKDGTFTISGLSKIDSGAGKGLYDFQNTPYNGTVTVTKVWLDDVDDSRREPTDIDLTVTTHIDIEPDPILYRDFVNVTLTDTGKSIYRDSNIKTIVFGSWESQKETLGYTDADWETHGTNVQQGVDPDSPDSLGDRIKVFVAGSGSSKTAYVLAEGYSTVVFPQNSSRMFYSCESLTSISFNSIDTSNVTDMSEMFYTDICDRFDNPLTNLTTLDLSGFDTSNVTNMSSMFSNCSSLATLDVSGWDTSNVTDMSKMFHWCSSLTELDLSGWDTSNVTNMCDMFSSCSNLTELDLSGFDTSKVTDMNGMFSDCYDLTELDLLGWDTSNVTDMSYMFSSCSSLTELDLSGLDTSNVTTMDHMFSNCSNLATLDVSGWDTSNVTTMIEMFEWCSSLTELDVTEFDTSNVTDMCFMFRLCSSLTELDLSGWNTSNVTNMGYMFNNCTSLTTVDFSDWDTSNVTNMNQMFAFCKSLTELDLSGLDTSNVTTMDHMFYYCSSLTAFDFSGWDTSNVTTMDGMFSCCYSLTELDLSGLDTSNVTSIKGMFNYCTSLTTLDLSGWDTSNVTNMSGMLTNCKSLTTFDFSGWDTSNVTTMTEMFDRCSSLTELDLSGWNTSNVKTMSYMFEYCSSLTTLDLSGWDTSKVGTSMYRMLSSCSNLTSVTLGAEFKCSSDLLPGTKAVWYIKDGNGEKMTPLQVAQTHNARGETTTYIREL